MAAHTDKWRLGIPLGEAVWRFASSRLRAEYEAAYQTSDDGEKIKLSDTMSTVELSQNFLRIWQQTMEPIQRRAEVRDEMRQLLLGNLAHGTMAAYGFPVDDGKASDQPDEVPPFMFEMKFVDWHNSSLEGLGREFVSVRVMRVGRTKARSFPTPPQSEPTMSSRERRLGRPSKIDLILDAIGTLYADQIHLTTLGSKEVGDLVRKRIVELTGQTVKDMKGLSDETIRRAHVRWQKNNSKQ